MFTKIFNKINNIATNKTTKKTRLKNYTMSLFPLAIIAASLAAQGCSFGVHLGGKKPSKQDGVVIFSDKEPTEAEEKVMEKEAVKMQSYAKSLKSTFPANIPDTAKSYKTKTAQISNLKQCKLSFTQSKKSGYTMTSYQSVVGEANKCSNILQKQKKKLSLDSISMDHISKGSFVTTSISATYHQPNAKERKDLDAQPFQELTMVTNSDYTGYSIFDYHLSNANSIYAMSALYDGDFMYGATQQKYNIEKGTTEGLIACWRHGEKEPYILEKIETINGVATGTWNVQYAAVDDVCSQKYANTYTISVG